MIRDLGAAHKAAFFYLQLLGEDELTAYTCVVSNFYIFLLFVLFYFLLGSDLWRMEESKTLADLKNKEKEVYKQLQGSTLFKHWEGLKMTINLFEKANGNTIGAAAKELEIPSEYDENLTWAEKTLFAINKLGDGFLQDIVDEIYELEPTIDKDTIYKRVSNMVSQLLKKGKIKVVKRIGRKIKLAIKKDK